MEKPRALVCIFGSIRASDITWESFQKHVLNELNADLALFIGTGSDDDQDDPFLTHATYRFDVPEPEDFVGAAVELGAPTSSSAQKTELIRILRRASRKWYQYSAIIGIYFKWLIARRLTETGLIRQYDWIIVTRSDFLWLAPHPPLSVLDNNIWIPDGEYHNGLPDRHLVIPSRFLNKALAMLPSLLTDVGKITRDTMLSRWGAEKLQLVSMIRNGVIHRVHVFPYVMFLVRSPADATQHSPGTYNVDLNAYVKYAEEHALAVKNASGIRVAEDWERVLVSRRSAPHEHTVTQFSEVLHALFALKVPSPGWIASWTGAFFLHGCSSIAIAALGKITRKTIRRVIAVSKHLRITDKRNSTW